MSFSFLCLLLAGGLFLGMFALLEAGRRAGMRRLKQDPDGARAGHAAIEGAVFALLGLLIAFTFSGAAARFDVRRQLIVEEANAVGTAWLRLDLVPAPAQTALRDRFRQYVDARLEVYQKIPDLEAAKAASARAQALQGEIWALAVSACQGPDGQHFQILLLPAFNQMFDIATSRMSATLVHPPGIIFCLLFGLSFGSAFLAGYGLAGGRDRSLSHMIGFSLIMAVTVYVILDLEYPRLGLLNLGAFDQVLVEVRQGMK